MSRDIVIKIRVSSEEKAAIDQLAGVEGLSEYIRRRILPEVEGVSVATKDTTYMAAAIKHAAEARTISITELGNTRLPPGSLGPYDSVVF